MGEASAEWISPTLHVLYEILGWIAFIAWSLSFYPQVVLNFKRKSVVGLNFDYLLLNLTKQNIYLLYNVCMYFIPVVQRQYHEKYGVSELIPVASSDVAYSIHSVLLTLVLVYQVLIYEKGGQRLSMITIGIAGGAWFAASVCVVVAWPHSRWLWLILIFNNIQVAITLIKYTPQAWMNYRRKSTTGYSIENILLDLCGGFCNIIQMGVQSIDQDSFDNFLGNVGKVLFSLVVLIFDGIFVVQHFCLYYQPNDAYTFSNLNKNEEAGLNADDTGVQSSESDFTLHGRTYVNFSRRFSDCYGRFNRSSCYEEVQALQHARVSSSGEGDVD